MRTCKNCRYLLKPTLIGYACKKRGLWGTDVPLFFDGYECKKFAQRNGKDDANKPFVPAEPLKPGIYRIGKHHAFTYED